MGDQVGVAILSLTCGLNRPPSHGQISSLLPDLHATEPQVGGQSPPVVACDAVWLQQHLQLLKELRGQPEAGRGKGYSQRGGPETQSGSTPPKCCTRLEALG